jgi:selenophosphate synthase
VCSDGSKQQMPIVAGKSLKTYCFNNKRIKTKTSLVKFYSNKSVIMTTTIFMDLLTAPDASIRVQARNMQLFMDNYATHMQDM